MNRDEIRTAAVGLDPDLPAGALPAKLPPPPVAKFGRPSAFNFDIANTILERIAGGKTLRQVCAADPALPHRSTVYRWRLERPDFERAFIFAQWCWVDELADRCIDIVEDESKDTTLEITGEDSPIQVVNEAHMKRQKMQLAEFHHQIGMKMPRREAAALPPPPVPGDDAKEINPKEPLVIDEHPLAGAIRAWEREELAQVTAA